MGAYSDGDRCVVNAWAAMDDPVESEPGYDEHTALFGDGLRAIVLY